MELRAFDFETHLIIRGNTNPMPVCLSRGTKAAPEVLHADYDRATVYAKLFMDFKDALAGKCRLVLQNAAYDLTVAASHFGIPLPLIFECLEAGVIHSVDVREMLIGVARGWTAKASQNSVAIDPRTGEKWSLSLAAMVKARFGVDISEAKSDSNAWRLRYCELQGIPLDHWPEPAVEYSKQDVVWPIAVYEDQQKEGDTPVGRLVLDTGHIVNEVFQTKAQFALHLMGMNGPRTDPKVAQVFREYHETVKREAFEGRTGEDGRVELQGAIALGYVYWNKRRYKDPVTGKQNIPGWSMYQHRFQQHVYDAWTSAGYPGVPWKHLTPKGQKNVAKGQPYTIPDNLDAKAHKDALKWVSLSEDAVVACPDEFAQLWGNSKTSQKMIDQYADILDLATWGPLTSSPNVLVNTGRTSWRGPNMQNPPRKGGFREGIVARSGNVFAFCDYSSVELVVLAQLQLWDFGQSSLADLLNSGIDPHLWFAAILLGLDYDEAKRRKKAGDLTIGVYRQAAKIPNYSYPGGSGPATAVGMSDVNDLLAIAEPQDQGMTDEETAINVAKRLKEVWLSTFPENQWSFARVSSKTRSGRTFTYAQQPTGEEATAKMASGRIRGGLGYCDGLNTRFQGMASDIIKDAAWEVTKACYLDTSSPLYGCRPWLLLHDELCLEGPEETANEWARELGRIMVDALARWCPDVKGEAVPGISRRWYKDVDLLEDENGIMRPWEPWKRATRTHKQVDANGVVHKHVELLDYWELRHCHGGYARIDGADEPTWEQRIAKERELGIASE